MSCFVYIQTRMQKERQKQLPVFQYNSSSVLVVNPHTFILLYSNWRQCCLKKTPSGSCGVLLRFALLLQSKNGSYYQTMQKPGVMEVIEERAFLSLWRIILVPKVFKMLVQPHIFRKKVAVPADKQHTGVFARSLWVSKVGLDLKSLWIFVESHSLPIVSRVMSPEFSQLSFSFCFILWLAQQNSE